MSTLNIGGNLNNCTLYIYPTWADMTMHTPTVSTCTGLSYSGEVTIDNGALTSLNISAGFNQFNIPFFSTLSNLTDEGWHLNTRYHTPSYGATLNFDFFNGETLNGTMSYWEQPGLPDLMGMTRIYNQTTVPLPSALTLFATALLLYVLSSKIVPRVRKLLLTPGGVSGIMGA